MKTKVLADALIPPDGYYVQMELISNRYSYKNRRALMRLNELQKKNIQDLIRNIETGVFRLKWHPCICGSKKFYIISEFDRYGIPLNTMICMNCSQLQSNPYLDESSTENFYNNFYRPIYSGSIYPPKNHFQEQLRHGKKIRFFFAKHNFLPGKNIFEVGCGGGGILKEFAENGHKVAGCDLGEDFLKIGKEKDIELYHGDCTVLENKGKADLIILSHIVEHFCDIKTEFNKIGKLLAPGGKIFIEVPGIEKLSPFYQGDLLRYFQSAHNWHFYLDNLNRIMESTGFILCFGSKHVMALYERSEKKPFAALPGEAKRVAVMLRKHELRRKWVKKYSKIRNKLSRVLTKFNLIEK